MAEKKNTTSPKKPVEAEVVEPVTPIEEKKEVRSEPKKRYRSGSIFWGIAFIVIGTLFLLDNLGIVSVHFWNLWQLWPILIIGTGISMLSLRGWLSGLLAVLLALTFGGLAYLVAVDNPYYNNQIGLESQEVTTLEGAVPSEAKNGLNLTLKTGAVNMNLSSNSDQKGYMAELRSSTLALAQTNFHVSDETQYVTVETSSTSNWWMGMGRMENNLNVKLTEDSALTLTIDTGASSVTGDLSSVKLGKLALKAGASNISLKFGAKVASQDITLDAGASKLVLSVPKDSGVRIDADSGLSHTDFEGVDKVSDTLYESSGFSSAKNQITIHAKIGASTFELRRY